MSEGDIARPQWQKIPSVNRILIHPALAGVLARFGNVRTSNQVRHLLEEARQQLRQNPDYEVPEPEAIVQQLAQELASTEPPGLSPVFNLTGTVLHTNLGRAQLPQVAIDALVEVAGHACNLEFDLHSGGRGDRDEHLESLLLELTGAEAVTVVNNNAAALLLCLNTLALNQEVCVSRGELVEIGDSFRIPEIMSRSGCHLVEVGATNRTHLQDYDRAINRQTGLLMKVHTSNYEIKGFTSAVSAQELAPLAHQHQLPLLVDLGSGTLVDLARFGLPPEPTVRKVLEAGADLVTFSGDKLLGGPQAGVIVGKQALLNSIKKNPMKRALRPDKMTIAALAAVLQLYRNPDQLATQLPTLRQLTKPLEAIDQTADALVAAFGQALAGHARVSKCPTFSQAGSGALPLGKLPSIAIEITPSPASEAALQQIAKAFRQGTRPVLGRLQDGKLLFDMRTLEDIEGLKQALQQLVVAG